MFKSCLVAYGSVERTFVDVNARCILGSFNICGTDKYRDEFEIYQDLYSVVC